MHYYPSSPAEITAAVRATHQRAAVNGLTVDRIILGDFQQQQLIAAAAAVPGAGIADYKTPTVHSFMGFLVELRPGWAFEVILR
jgi:hypothetical protein